jgi:hypothetical protein
MTIFPSDAGDNPYCHSVHYLHDSRIVLARVCHAKDKASATRDADKSVPATL